MRLNALMDWFAPRGWIIAVALALFPAEMRAVELPFSIDTRDGQWKVSTVRKAVGPDITFEAVVAHVAGAERMIIMSAPLGEGPAESLSEFGQGLKAAFSGFRSSSEAVEKEDKQFGYAGRTLTFDLVKAEKTMDVELFVFVDGKTRWGVLHSVERSAAGVRVSPAAFSLLQKKAPQTAGVVTLEPFRVKDDAVGSFPISFSVERVGNRVKEILVTKVIEGSSTERMGVRVGDKIVKIDGRKTEDFAGGTGKDSEIGRIFLNREAGDMVKLDLISAADGKPYTATLRVSSPFGSGAERVLR